MSDSVLSHIRGSSGPLGGQPGVFGSRCRLLALKLLFVGQQRSSWLSALFELYAPRSYEVLVGFWKIALAQTGYVLLRRELLVLDIGVVVRPSTRRTEAVHIVLDIVVAELAYLFLVSAALSETFRRLRDTW